MQEIRSQNISFGSKNVALIFSFALFLGFAAYMQTPDIFSGHFSVLKPFSAFNKSVSLATPPAPFRFSPISKAEVLGASTYDKNFVQQFSSIPVKTINDNSNYAFQNYADQVNAVLTGDQIHSLSNQAVANSNDLQLKNKETKFLRDLQAIAAPSSLLDYARVSIAKYAFEFSEHSKLDAQSKQNSQSVLAELDTQINFFKNQIKQNSGVTLP